MSERDIKVQAIISLISGAGLKRKIFKVTEGICSRENCSLNISFIEYVGHASKLTRQAIEEGAEYILVAGGGGAVNETTRVMTHSNAILGIISKDSGSDLARELHVPMNVRRATDLIAKRHVTTIGCCWANGQIFFCTCGVGLDAVVNQKFANEKWCGSPIYMRNMIEEYLSYKPGPYELVVDNQTIKEKVFLITRANASQYGNNAFIAPHVNIQDGWMDATILSPSIPSDIAPLAIRLLTKQIDRSSKIKTTKAQQVTIIHRHPGVMYLDGEPITANRRIDITVEPKALYVLAPEVALFTKKVYSLFDEVTRFFDKKFPYTFKQKPLAIAVSSLLHRCRSISRAR